MRLLIIFVLPLFICQLKKNFFVVVLPRTVTSRTQIFDTCIALDLNLI